MKLKKNVIFIILTGLWLKSKGISPRVADLCSTLESRLSNLLSDLATVCSDKELDPAILADTQALKSHQQVVCSEAISRLDIQYTVTVHVIK